MHLAQNAARSANPAAFLCSCMVEEPRDSAGHPSFVCAAEATALLNCVANKSFNQQRCITSMRKLRECILKEVLWCPCSTAPGFRLQDPLKAFAVQDIADFTLLPEESCTAPFSNEQ